MDKNIKIAMFGASGKLGSHVVDQALAAGYNLRALVRNKSKFRHADHPQVETIVGDSTKPEDVAQVVAGANVVISCLGTVDRKVMIMAASFDNIMTAAAAQDSVPRCLMISTTGCGGTSWLIKGMLSLIIVGKACFNDYEQADRRVREDTSVPFVLVRPYILADTPGSGEYVVSEKRSVTFAQSIPRADVATFLIDCVADTQWDGSVILTGKKKK